MEKIGKVNILEEDAEHSAPEPGDILFGNPRFKLWYSDMADDGVSVGVWESSPGKWHFTSLNWEYFHLLQGVSIVSESGGRSYTLNPGDSLILRPGFEGTWESVETTRKHFVVKA